MFIAFVLLSPLSAIANLSPDEEARLSEQVRSLNAAYEEGNADKIVEMTFKPVVAMVGGAEAMKGMVQKSMNAQKDAGVIIESYSIGKPTEPIVAGEDVVTFIPKVTVMKMPGKRARSTTFMVGARKVKDKTWYFMDGAGFRKKPTMIYTFFPSLPQNLVLPENSIEFIE